MTNTHSDVDYSIDMTRLDAEAMASRTPNIDRPPDPKLVAEGWERRFMTSVTRLNEYVELYTSLGYEVRTELVRSDEIDPECNDCRLILYRQIVTIYTRKRSEQSARRLGSGASPTEVRDP